MQNNELQSIFWGQCYFSNVRRLEIKALKKIGAYHSDGAWFHNGKLIGGNAHRAVKNVLKNKTKFPEFTAILESIGLKSE